jgi:hypothetical protein
VASLAEEGEVAVFGCLGGSGDEELEGGAPVEVDGRRAVKFVGLRGEGVDLGGSRVDFVVQPVHYHGVREEAEFGGFAGVLSGGYEELFCARGDGLAPGVVGELGGVFVEDGLEVAG